MPSTLAASFYVSDVFWTAAAVIVAVLTLAGTVWATLRAANPKRELTHRMTNTRLVRTDHNVGVLQISRDGVSLTDPRVVRIQLTNPGRRDISAAAFDGRRIKVDVGQPILELLSSTADPDTSEPPKAEVDDTKLLISPGRIGRGESVSYVLLVDGEPSYDLKHSLVDVAVKEEDVPDRRSIWKFLSEDRAAIVLIPATTAAFLLPALVVLLDEDPTPKNLKPEHGPTVYIPVDTPSTTRTPLR